MLNIKKIIKMYNENALLYLLECEEKVKVSTINKTLKKITNNKVFFKEMSNSIDRDELDINILSDNIKSINSILENGGYLLCHESFNPLINNSNIELLIGEKEILEGFVKITKSNLAEYRDKLEKFIITNSIVNPFIEVSKNELDHPLIYDTYKNNCIYLIKSGFGSSRDFENMLNGNGLLELEEMISGLFKLGYHPRNFSISLANVIHNNQKSFEMLNSLIKKNNSKKDYLSYVGKILYKDTDKIHANSHLEDLICNLQEFKFTKEEIGDYFLKINLSRAMVSNIYNRQFERLGVAYPDFADNWMEKINKNVFKEYVEYNPYIPSDDSQKMKFFGRFSSKARNKLIKEYNNMYHLNESIVYQSVNQEKDGAIISLNDISKRIASNLYYDKLNLDYDYQMVDNKIKVKRSKEHIFISYPKGMKNEYVNILVFGLINCLFEKQEEGYIYNMPNNEITEQFEKSIEGFCRVIDLKIKTSENKISKSKPKI